MLKKAFGQRGAGESHFWRFLLLLTVVEMAIWIQEKFNHCKMGEQSLWRRTERRRRSPKSEKELLVRGCCFFFFLKANRRFCYDHEVPQIVDQPRLAKIQGGGEGVPQRIQLNGYVSLLVAPNQQI